MVDAVPLSEPCARKTAHLGSRGFGRSKILPIQEDLAACDIDGGYCSLREDDWTVKSLSDVEPQQALDGE